MKLSRECASCLTVAGLSLAVAAACHCFAPGLGAVIRPLFWPVALALFGVRLRAACATAFAVPFVSCLLTGMPTAPVALALSASAVAVVVTVRTVGDAIRSPRRACAARLESAPDRG